MQKFVSGLMACALMAGAAPQLAFADQVPASEAKLATPLAAPRKVIIDARTWRCSGDVCKGAEQGTIQPSRRECGKLVKEVGPIVSYADDKRELSADDLTACNAAAQKG